MARKGWESLSEPYRARLKRQGITRPAYEGGASLHKARGKGTPSKEAFNKRTSRFVHTFGVPGDSPDIDIARIRALGPTKGQEYMDYRRKMTKLYERGDYRQAETLYLERDQSQNLPVHMWWYHGMFGG